jgi:hypothetical protein
MNPMATKMPHAMVEVLFWTVGQVGFWVHLTVDGIGIKAYNATL